MIAMEIIFFERAKNKMGFCKAFFGYSNDDFRCRYKGFLSCTAPENSKKKVIS